MDTKRGSLSYLIAKTVITVKPAGAAAKKQVGRSRPEIRCISRVIRKELIKIITVARANGMSSRGSVSSVNLSGRILSATDIPAPTRIKLNMPGGIDIVPTPASEVMAIANAAPIINPAGTPR